MAKTRKIELVLAEYGGIDELNSEDRLLVEKAMKASDNAYAPYSHFSVGAALILNTGEIITSANRENASYPVGLCAEHSAVASAGSNHPGSVIRSIAICARSEDGFTDLPVSPCGKCRQVICEEEDRTGEKIRIILYGKSCIYISEGIGNLLPLHFSGSDLGH